MSAAKCSDCVTCADICDAIPVGHTMYDNGLVIFCPRVGQYRATSIFRSCDFFEHAFVLPAYPADGIGTRPGDTFTVSQPVTTI